MLNKLRSIALSLFLIGATLFTCIGYAVLTDTLSVTGDAEFNPFDFDGVVITEISTVSGTTVTEETHFRSIPTNVKSTITGNQGQSIVYRITAHNYSETDTYVYTGIFCGDEFADVASKLTLSASTDTSKESPLPNDIATTYTSLTPVKPGEDFVFYATYDLNSNIAAGEILVRYVFMPVIYSVTYLNENAIYAVDCITDNSVAYHVRAEGPNRGDQVFADWVNASAVGVDSYPAGNINDYTLSAKWDNVYLVMFVDEHGQVLYQESFTDTSKKNGLSAQGQAIVDAKLAELAEIAAAEEMSVAWSSYSIQNATSDITVRPVYTYTGNLRFTPVDQNNDGIIEFYQVDAVSKLNGITRIPGRFNGLEVQVVNKLYLNDNNFDYGAGVTTIIIEEGIKELRPNALAYTEDLRTVHLPSTMEYIGKNAFSRNWGSDQKVMTIEYNGTMAEWQALVNNSHNEWHNGLKDGSVVRCKDGYFELDRGFLGLGGYKWNAKSY